MEVISLAIFCTMAVTAVETGIISSEQGQLFLFITFIINIIVQIYREIRQRRWDLADRLEARKQLEVHEQTMTKKVDEQTETLSTKLDEKTAEQIETLQQSMRSRVGDFSKSIDGLLNNPKRRKDD